MKHRLLLAVFLGLGVVWAHPMGTFSVSHYSLIQVTPGGADIRYILDLAEVPTVQLLQQWKLEATSPREEIERQVTSQARQWAANLKIEVDGHAVLPGFERAETVLGKGDRDMPVLRVTIDLHIAATPGKLQFEDTNYPDRSGWKEIVTVAGQGVVLDHALPKTPDRSQALTTYPQDLRLTPPQDLRASIEWHSGQGAATQSATDGGIRGDFLSRLLHQGEISWGMMLVGLCVAFGLGAIHALSPGHGKTIVAAYLVGSRGTPKHALFLGGMVTFTHTISVFALGLTMLFLSQYVLPEKIITVLGAISGLSIVFIGATLLNRRIRLARSHGHHHHHHHDHSHGGLAHDHGDGHVHSHVPEGEISMGSLIALGASGGLVPCPSALVLLLSAEALGRIGLGLVLLMAFSAGLAVVLSGIGSIVLYAKHLLPDSKTTANNMAFHYLPVASAAFIVCAGLLMTGVVLGVIRPFAGV